jgi:hypothetical protein
MIVAEEIFVKSNVILILMFKSKKIILMYLMKASGAGNIFGSTTLFQMLRCLGMYTVANAQMFRNVHLDVTCIVAF